nr:MAG TPA: hypothetical protein [Caudoviricetes sp.]
MKIGRIDNTFPTFKSSITPPRVMCGLVFRPIFKTNSRIFKSFHFVFGFDM